MIRVFEAFSGVGAQHMALRNLGIKYKVVATSDIDINAILAYYYVHENDNNENNYKDLELEKKYIMNLGIADEIKLSKMTKEAIDELYIACVKTKNLGDINKIKPQNVPDHDLFTYSFPCQDISSVGTQKGLDKDSGTRSSLLWECKKIIDYKKPKYLMLENVKNLTTGKNKDNFIKWLNYLESIGYENYWKIFDAKDYGIPQRRPRVIVMSKLGRSSVDLVKKNDVNVKTIYDIIDNSHKFTHKFIPKIPVEFKMNEGEYKFLDDRDWKMNGIMIGDLCSTQRAGRVGLKCIYKHNSNVYERKLSALECCRLMGFNDEDYKKMKNGKMSDASIMKICGNSIVVNVLENVFTNLIEDIKND